MDKIYPFSFISKLFGILTLQKINTELKPLYPLKWTLTKLILESIKKSTIFYSIFECLNILQWYKYLIHEDFFENYYMVIHEMNIKEEIISNIDFPEYGISCDSCRSEIFNIYFSCIEHNK